MIFLSLSWREIQRATAMDDQDTIERIGAALRQLEQHGLANGNASSLRLYQTRSGGFVRVLDDDAAPLTAEMLRAIEAFTSKASEVVAMEEKGVSVMAEAEDVTMDGDCTPVVGEHTEERDDTTYGDVEMFEDNDIAVQPRTEEAADEPALVNPPIEETTLASLASHGINPAAWLNGEDQRTSNNDDQSGLDLGGSIATSPITTQAQLSSVQATPFIVPLMEQWPRELLTRTRICSAHRASVGSSAAVPPQCVIYWLRSTLRVGHGNFGLAVAKQLATQLRLPVAVVTLLPTSIILPVRHAVGVNDALSRWSIVDLRQRLQAEGIEVFGFTMKQNWNRDAATAKHAIDGGVALYTLMQAFSPAAVVADDGFSMNSRIEVDSLQQYLETRVQASWSLLAVDSMTCLPFQSLSPAVQKSLDNEVPLDEDTFTAEYNQLHQQHSQLALSLGTPPLFQRPLRPIIKEAVSMAIKRIELDEVMWQIVEPLTAQSTATVQVSSEFVAVEKLDLLVASTDTRPAIQQELQGSGILSLLPFIRHGSLSAGYVLDKLAQVIASLPPPKDASSRKTFAMLKVLRSRAFSYFARERDYALYLSLWAARRAESELKLTGVAVSFRALVSFKVTLSELDAYRSVLPSWISANTSLQGGDALLKSAYDPYQLESGRTDDAYWNEIQQFHIETRYLHPLVVVYWGYRILQWSVSIQAAIATMESLLDKCSLGSLPSPDTVSSVWMALFRIGRSAETREQFLQRIEAELSSQQQLQIRK